MTEHVSPEPSEAAEANEPSRLDETGELGEQTRRALDEIEAQPLAERAAGYRRLADGLRIELEESDPTRNAG